MAEIFTAKAQRSQRFAKKIKALREQHLSSNATHRVNGQYDPPVVSFAIFAVMNRVFQVDSSLGISGTKSEMGLQTR